MTSTPSTSKYNQIAPQVSVQQPKENNEPRLNDILVALTNVTQTLANITARMGKLETIYNKPKMPNRKINDPYTWDHNLERQWVSTAQTGT